MKLLTHNLLSVHVQAMGACGFALCLQATEVRINPVESKPDFMAGMIPKVEWAVLWRLQTPCICSRYPKSQFRDMSIRRIF
ncbi:hypothetical protein E2I00_017657 [Balaenoptera physalus]|uniref:Uncharacterized protein n=1 Tax=Balaenoptera physalus TaxID=9770 RepID=A0A6A1QBQ8_BALPH|nr:hypothetical protein E2I00_017657 [Balaenoptera physalus]